MCGIAGLFPNHHEEKPEPKKLEAMIKLIEHRGPDAMGVRVMDGLGFAHARLSIIDLHTEANQPMEDAETGNLLIFNGEIYNYIEIRKELELCGHHFHTQSDTEVILKAYAEWGVDCQNHFNGMWAFALFDTKQKKLFLSRDRMGVKPMVFGITQDKQLVFASEAKAIVEVFPEFKQPNMPFLADFIQTGFFACFEETFYRGLYNLMPGHFMLLEHGEPVSQKRYWQWVPNPETNKPSDNESVETFSALLEDAIRLRFRSDVPVGACLSGGLDSGTIVGLASRIFEKPIHTFSCIYPNSPEFDESEYIRASAESFKTEAQFVEPSHDDFISLVKQSIYEQDGPTGGASVLSQRAVMKLAGQHVKVLLDGQGADELIGGYQPYFYHQLATLLKQALRRPSINNWRAYHKAAKAVELNTSLDVKHLSLKSALHGVRSKKGFQTKTPATNHLSYMQPFKRDALSSLLLEHTFTNLTDLLHYEDRNAMAFSVESRLPFLDYRLVEYVFSLGHHYKMREGRSKWLLYQISKGVLPQKVLQRRDKMGFSTPAAKWFLDDAPMHYLTGCFDKQSTVLEALPMAQKKYLKSHFEQLKSTRTGDLNAVWRLFNANLWLESLVEA